MTRTKTFIAALALAAASASSLAHAQKIKTIEDYMRVAGEVSAGRLECHFAYNSARLLELGRPFQMASPDEAAVSKVSDLMAESMELAISRVRDEGVETACPRLLEAYGPQGNVAPGILNSPGTE